MKLLRLVTNNRYTGSYSYTCRPATGDYLLCHTGTLAQGFMLWCPGAIDARASHQTFIAVYQSIVGHRTIATHTCQ